jgi:hypothetical protein
MSDNDTINIRQLIKALEPDELGKFEGLSGMLLLNLSQADYMAAFQRYASNAPIAADVDLIRTINHESYHGLQTAASGYGFDRQRRLFAELNSLDELPQPKIDAETQGLIDNIRTEAGDNAELKVRAERAIAMMLAQRSIEWMDARAAPGDHSIYGALHPGFYRFQDALATREAKPNADGLSIQGVLEGSAVVYTHLLMNPSGEAQAKIEAELATLPPVYRQIYDLTCAEAGERALELLLPAVAVALCYSEPHQAFLPVLRLLAASAPGEALARGRELIAKLPEIEAAGAVLGTAIDVRRGDEAYRIYDQFISELETMQFGVDAYAVLANPDASNQLRSFPFALVTSDWVQAIKGSMDSDGMIARMALMAMVLRVGGRRKEEVAVRKLQVQWARDVLGRLMG